VAYSKTQIPEDGQSEILHLQAQLQLRDQLVDQLSSELYRLIKANPAALPPANSSPLQPQESSLAPTRAIAHADTLQQELTALESQIEFYQTQIDKRDAQIAHLQNSCQSLSDRNQMLEHIIQELPEVYRQKFSHRLDQVKTKVKSLQLENRRLYSALQASHDPLTPPNISLPARGKPSRD
jgi:chromosome segregation ATPase